MNVRKLNEKRWVKIICLGVVLFLALAIVGQADAFWQADLQAQGTITVRKAKADQCYQGDIPKENDKKSTEIPIVITDDESSTETSPVVLPGNSQDKSNENGDATKDNGDISKGNDGISQTEGNETPDSNETKESSDLSKKTETSNSNKKEESSPGVAAFE